MLELGSRLTPGVEIELELEGCVLEGVAELEVGGGLADVDDEDVAGEKLVELLEEFVLEVMLELELDNRLDDVPGCVEENDVVGEELLLKRELPEVFDKDIDDEELGLEDGLGAEEGLLDGELD